MRPSKIILAIFFALFCSACATYYQINYEFNQQFEAGNLEAAEQVLAKNDKAEEGKAKFLYFANRGVVTHLLGKYEESNSYLEEAYLLGEDYQKNYLNLALSMVSNPMVMQYPGEDHEHLMVLYYKALNFLKMGDRQSALVECRRLQDRLQSLSDKYNNDFRYDQDAFIHTLMGLIYDAEGDVNNAFIAYRNAYDIYVDDYAIEFGLSAPEQLKDDLLRTAYLMGFDDELVKYENEFGRQYQPSVSDGGYLLFFWNNGLAPVKSEWSINFTAVPGANGMMTFVNDQYGFNFPFDISSVSDDERSGLQNLEFFRVAFPKYTERPTYYDDAVLTANGKTYEAEKAEDINAIAQKVLRQRMVAEFGKSLLRFALKKAAEEMARDENEGFGAAIGLLNAITEKADTRNWQTMPSAIHYARIPLDTGMNNVRLEISSNKIADKTIYDLKFDGVKGRTHFHSFHSLEVMPPYINRAY